MPTCRSQLYQYNGKAFAGMALPGGADMYDLVCNEI